MIRKILLVLLGLVVVSSLVFPTLGSKPAAKEKEKFFTIYYWADLSRIYGFINVPRLLGIQDTVYWINKYKGGVHGRKFRVEWADHTNDLSVGATIYERWRTRKNFIFMAVCGSQENEAFHDRYAEDEVVVHTCGVSERGIYPAGYAFATVPLYPDQVGTFIDYLTETWDRKKHGRGPRLAFMTYDTPFGRGCLAPLALEYAKKKGVEVVDKQFIPVIVVDAATPLTRAKKVGADYVYGNFLWQTLVSLAKANKKLDFGIKFAACTWAVDEPLPMLGGKAAEGILGVNTMKLWSETDDPFIKQAANIANEVGRRRKDLGSFYNLGVANVLCLYDALNQLVPKVGWEGVNGRVLRRQLESWGSNYDLGGLVNVDYTPEFRTPLMGRLVEIKNGKWVQKTNWRKMPVLIGADLRGPYKEPSTPPLPKKVY